MEQWSCKIKKVILDTGLIPSTKGSRVYAAVKGISDAGIKINYDAKMIPSKERLEGENSKIKDNFKDIREKIK